MEEFVASRYDELLRLPELNLSAALIAGVGFRAEDDRLQHLAKVRKPAGQLFIHMRG